MEGCIQSHDDPATLTRKVDNLRIARSCESLFPDVGGLYPGGLEMADCGTREALIKQQPHRAWDMGNTLSSTKAAA
jgi:hypothetical protein